MSKKQLVIPDIPINGFCYPYAKALLDKMKELEKENRIFEGGEENAASVWQQGKGHTETTVIARLIFYALVGQIELFSDYLAANPEELKKDMAIAEEFLAIFEKK